MNNIDKQTTKNIQRYGLAWNVSPKPDKSSRYWYDLNADGVVDIADLNYMLTNRENSLKSSDDYIIGDINLDGQINSEDLAPLVDKLDIEKDNNQATDSTSQNPQTNLLSRAN